MLQFRHLSSWYGRFLFPRGAWTSLLLVPPVKLHNVALHNFESLVISVPSPWCWFEINYRKPSQATLFIRADSLVIIPGRDVTPESRVLMSPEVSYLASISYCKIRINTSTALTSNCASAPPRLCTRPAQHVRWVRRCEEGTGQRFGVLWWRWGEFEWCGRMAWVGDADVCRVCRDETVLEAVYLQKVCLGSTSTVEMMRRYPGSCFNRSAA